MFVVAAFGVKEQRRQELFCSGIASGFFIQSVTRLRLSHAKEVRLRILSTDTLNPFLSLVSAATQCKRSFVPARVLPAASREYV